MTPEQRKKRNNEICAECGKTRQAHYDFTYCYAATRYISKTDTTYIFPIDDFHFTPFDVVEDNCGENKK